MSGEGEKMKNKFFLIFILAVLIGVVSTVTYFSFSPKKIIIYGSIPHFSEDELILNSELIISGKVTDIKESRWSNPYNLDGKRNVLQTDIEVEIKDIIYGEYKNNTVIVRIDKGYDKKERVNYISDGYPDFKNDEEVLLFLSRDDGDLKTDEDYFVVTGMLQGKWNITDGKAQNLYSNVNYSLEKSTVEELKEKVQEKIKLNSGWKENQEKKKEQIKEENIKLFGN